MNFVGGTRRKSSLQVMHNNIVGKSDAGHFWVSCSINPGHKTLAHTLNEYFK